MKNLSNKIKSKLILKGLTIRKFAEILNLHESTVRRKINGSAVLIREDIVNFSKVLELSQNEVLEIFLPELLQ